MFITTDKDKLSKKYIAHYLEKLEDRIDLEHIEKVTGRQLDVFNFRKVKRLPVILTLRSDAAHSTLGRSGWPVFLFDQMWNDYAAMLLNELQPVYESVIIKDDKVFSARPNLSQIVVPSLFGADGRYDRINEDSMPYIYGIPEKDTLSNIIDEGVEIKKHRTIRKYCEIIDFWKELLSPYLKLNKCVHFSLPDLQGPFNLYFLLRGQEAYTDLFDKPEFVHRVMDFITGILIEITNYLAEYIGQTEYAYYWNYVYPGKIRNVDDNSTQISREHYLEFVHPYNVKLAKDCGGGIHHYCGQGDHIIDDIMSIPGTCGLNFGNPEMQNFDFVYGKALKYKTILLWDKGIPVEIFKTLKTGVIMKIVVSSLKEAQEKMAEFPD
ncbi:MAG: hypothetical protein GXP33_16260 [Spirochaetes bacterium]|nr:hypothetical protein [Spirochaetota bacterium]